MKLEAKFKELPAGEGECPRKVFFGLQNPTCGSVVLSGFGQVKTRLIKTVEMYCHIGHLYVDGPNRKMSYPGRPFFLRVQQVNQRQRNHDATKKNGRSTHLTQHQEG